MEFPAARWYPATPYPVCDERNNDVHQFSLQMNNTYTYDSADFSFLIHGQNKQADGITR
jgi:hypothetical protein